MNSCSLKNILLDCIVTAVILACFKKNPSKFINFGVILNKEENMQPFQHITHHFQKGKNAAERKAEKNCAVMEKVL